MDVKNIKLLDGTGTDMIDCIFEAKAEELAQINENDKKILDDKFIIIDKKYSELQLMVDKMPAECSNLKTSLIEKFNEYINLSDEINAYFNSKYYKERT